MATLEVRVTPRSSAAGVGPLVEGVLEVRVTQPPADGAANRAVLRLVADALSIAPSRLVLVAGQRGRRKRIRIDELDGREIARRLAGPARD